MKKKIVSLIFLAIFILVTYASLSASISHPCDKYLGPNQIENGEGCANAGGNCCW